MNELLHNIIGVLSPIAQIGLGYAAWRLANALKFRVDDHEVRIVRLETRPA